MASTLNTVITVSLVTGLGLAGAYFFRLMCPGQPLSTIGNGTWCPPTAPLLSPATAAVFGDIQKPGTKGVVLPAVRDTPWLTSTPSGIKCCQGNSCTNSTSQSACCSWRGSHGGCSSGYKGVAAGNGCSCVKSTTTPAPATKPWCPGKSGNCTWDCKSAYCWTSGNQKWCGQCTGCGTNIVTGCNLARQGYLKSQCNGFVPGSATYNACLKAHGLMAKLGSRRARITIS